MISLLASLAVKYGQALVVAGVSLIVRQLEKNAIVKKFNDKINDILNAK
jgi:hypothetical protein